MSYSVQHVFLLSLCTLKKIYTVYYGLEDMSFAKPPLPYLLPPTPHPVPASQPEFSDVNNLPSFLREAFVCAIHSAQAFLPCSLEGCLLYKLQVSVYTLAPQALLHSPI